MRVKLQLVMCSDDGHEETITDIVTRKEDSQSIEDLGLTLKEAKQLLTTTQKRLLHHQVETFLDGCSTCPDCGAPLREHGEAGDHAASASSSTCISGYQRLNTSP